METSPLDGPESQNYVMPRPWMIAKGWSGLLLKKCIPTMILLFPRVLMRNQPPSSVPRLAGCPTIRGRPL